jgi:hypothetical protein
MPDQSSSGRPRNANQLGKLIVDISVGEVEDPRVKHEKNPAAVALGSLGGRKGGSARAAKLTAEQRSEIAQKAAQARWRGSRE